MFVLHPLDPLDRRRPDDVYAAEAAACDRLGIAWTLIDHDALVQGEAGRAVLRVPVQPRPVFGVYRGWMATVEQYALFYEALEARGVRLVNTPDAYRHCHHLPESYPLIEGHTPRSVWLPGTGEIDLDSVRSDCDRSGTPRWSSRTTSSRKSTPGRRRVSSLRHRTARQSGGWCGGSWSCKGWT